MKNKIKRIALERIKYLFELAKKNPEMSKRYLYILWKIKLKARVKLPKYIKRSFCKKCFTLWIPGKTCKIRIRKKWIILTCLGCGRVYKWPAKR